ncbi:transcriptional repressor [Pseudomonas sp. BMS12]|uniref:transcriptional repressor n=1 Tax=Pseudomonas sp. BMS12 TaxID=1796033 RepID=UPI00083A9404|nr:transcriptional repressor [Pseudomonas sp. BMS12]
MNSDERRRLRAILQEAGLKNSLARLKILEALDCSDRALRARELQEQLWLAGEQISILTVRQVLSRLGTCGVVRRDEEGRYHLCRSVALVG